MEKTFSLATESDDNDSSDDKISCDERTSSNEKSSSNENTCRDVVTDRQMDYIWKTVTQMENSCQRMTEALEAAHSGTKGIG